MFNIEIVEKKGIQLVDSKLLHKLLEVKSQHKDWIRRRIENYSFVEGEDYKLSSCSKKSTKIKHGGSNRKDYLLTVDMAKELAMLENNDIGKKARSYFINIEKEYRRNFKARILSIETRKTLMNSVDESGENERMHGHGYATYTKMVYKLTGLSDKFKFWKLKSKAFRDEYKGNFRDYIEPEELKRVEIAEGIIKPLLEMDKEYGEIKDIIEPLFKTKELI